MEGPSISRMRESWTHHSQKIVIGLAVVMALSTALMFSGIGSDMGPAQEPENREVVATIAGTDVRRDQLESAALQYGDKPIDPRDGLRMQGIALQSFVDRAIKIDAAKKAGITVSGDELQAEMDRLYKEVSEQRGFAALNEKDREPFERQLRSRMRESEDDIRDGLLVKKWEDSFKDKINPNDPKTSPQDVEVRARHILIKTKDPKAPAPPKGTPAKDLPLPEAEAKKKAEQLLAEAKKPGADFAALAKKHSQDTSADKGGDLDWFGKGQMVPEFDQAVFSMKPGQVSDLVKTQFGYHIIKLEDKRVSDSAKSRLVNDYMEKARKTAKIQFSDEVLQGINFLDESLKVSDKPKEKEKLMRQALAHFENARKKDPGDVGVLALIADTQNRLYNQGNMKDKKLRDQTIKAFEAAVALTPAPRMRVDLAKLYEDAGQKEKALEQMKKAAEVAYTDPGVRYELKSGFDRLGQQALAKEQQKVLDDAARNNPMGGMNFPGGMPGGMPGGGGMPIQVSPGGGGQPIQIDPQGGGGQPIQITPQGGGEPIQVTPQGGTAPAAPQGR